MLTVAAGLIAIGRVCIDVCCWRKMAGHQYSYIDIIHAVIT